MTPGEIFDRAAAAAKRANWFVHQMNIDDHDVELCLANTSLVPNWRTLMTTRRADVHIDRAIIERPDAGDYIDSMVARIIAAEPVTS
jgi:hypothetical protein